MSTTYIIISTLKFKKGYSKYLTIRVEAESRKEEHTDEPKNE